MGLTQSQREVLHIPNPLPRRRSFLSSIPSLSLTRRSIGVIGRSIGIAGRTVGPSDVVPDTEIDHFESGDLSAYQDDTGDIGDVNKDSPIWEGDYSFKIQRSQTANFRIWSTSGLENYPDVGNTHRFRHYIEEFEDPAAEPSVFFGLTGDPFNDDGYQLTIDVLNNQLRIRRVDSGSSTDLGFVDGFIWSQEWNAIETSHESNGDLTVTICDEDLNELDSETINDDTHLSNGSYDGTAVGMSAGRNGLSIMDFWGIL